MMFSRFCVSLILLLVAPSFTATADDLLNDCQNQNSNISIPACTALIAEGEEFADGDEDMDFLSTLHSIRALAYLSAREYAKAASDLSTAIQIGTDKTDKISLLNLRAKAYFYAGDTEGALADYTASIKAQPNEATSYNGRGFIFLKLKKYDAAIADYDMAIKLQPDYAQSIYGRGLAQRAKGDAAGAQKDIAAASVLAADVAEAFVQAGVDNKP